MLVANALGAAATPRTATASVAARRRSRGARQPCSRDGAPVTCEPIAPAQWGMRAGGSGPHQYANLPQAAGSWRGGIGGHFRVDLRHPTPGYIVTSCGSDSIRPAFVMRTNSARSWYSAI